MRTKKSVGGGAHLVTRQALIEVLRPDYRALRTHPLAGATVVPVAASR